MSRMKSSLTGAWKLWLDEHSGKLLMFARQRTQSMADAEDVLQDCIVRLWRYQSDRGHVPPDLPLAFHTLRFCMMDYGRKQQRKERKASKIIEFTRGEDVWHDLALEDDEDAAILRKAVEALPLKLREVVMLKIWGGITFAEIGQTLDISHNTAASRYRYALEQLQRKLQGLKNSRHG